MQSQNEIVQTSNVQKNIGVVTIKNSVNVSDEDAQWQADKWIRIVAIIILVIFVFVVIIPSLMPRFNQTYYVANTNCEEIIFVYALNNQLELLDNFNLAKEQYLIIRRVKISFNLEYLGGYSTGIDWDISECYYFINEE